MSSDRHRSDIALQLVHAGNLRSAIDIANRALGCGQFGRLLIATDTPTGTGVVSLGMLRQMAELASLSELPGRQVVSACTGNVAAVYGLDGGLLEVGRRRTCLSWTRPSGGG